MKSICITLLLLSLSLIAFAQQTYIGTVINRQTKAPIPYITIKLTKEKIATAADDKGDFELVSTNGRTNDTLLLSGVGYKAVKVPIQGFINNTKIELIEDAVFLNEVRISSNKRKLIKKELNPFKTSQVTLPEQPFAMMAQAAIKLSSPEIFSLLKTVKINRRIGDYDTYTNTEARFRIHVFDVDSVTGGPGEDIVHQIIEVYDKDKREIEIDLTPYNIVIPGKDFFVGVEWLYISANESISGGLGHEFHGLTYMDYEVLYHPIIHNIRSDKSGQKIHTWYKVAPRLPWEFLGAKGKTFFWNIAISAEIEY
ncbi:hypothetical protein GCM10023149_31270 [Mucilaginibacter gynuensis]|uniref:Carboxypeptidase-like protein n=1 Tax=Mucilaginibacter gynuensis TaxID=1302236 RepID=A0ABP8GNV0_9SPHI